ncbi:hypothetical protein AF332_11935 [Sporosarcina globispora]|uniref:HNH domain-containing protein n=1 Tax=Sporosarcina globispora TaxID=1459 RepID=A0A0M0GKG6_SPOGL|nr:hypothetical protein AF332_11935 [Sporosarcina globispora]
MFNDITYKVCTNCSEWFEMNDENFYINKSNSLDGYHPYCKQCSSKKAKKWCDDNPEITKAAKRKYNKSPKGRPKLAANAQRQRENGDYYKWRRENKEYLYEWRRKRDMNKKHEISATEWESCKKYFNDCCAYCGITEEQARDDQGQNLHKEHVNHRGANDLSNCIPSCRICNSSKWAKDFDEFYNKDNLNFTAGRLHKIRKWLTEDYLLYKE